MAYYPTALKLFFWPFGQLMPKTAAKLAYKAMSSPRSFDLRPRELESLAQAIRQDIVFNGASIATYRWGSPKDPLALLVHGWEGQAGNMGAIATRLVQEGMQVLAFDAIAHGQSEKRSSDMFEYTDLVGHLLETEQPKMLISHSFGSVAATYAMHRRNELGVDKLVLLTSPDKFEDRINEVADEVGMPKKASNALIALLEQKTGIHPSQLSVSGIAAELKVKEVLLIHDEGDKIIQFAWSERIQQAFPNAKLVPLKGSGHYRMLWDDALLNALAAFAGSSESA